MESLDIKRESDKHLVNVDLGVCILFYEKLEQTIECISSFLPSGVKIYILNNGSSLIARKALGRFCEKHENIIILDSETNKGVAAGRNYLLLHTTEEWLLFVDNDIFVKSKDWPENFAKYVSLYDDIEVFIPKLFNLHENSYSSYRSIRVEGTKVIYDQEIIGNLTNTFPGGASFINRKLFNRLGYYDEKMFVGFEDFEFCIRGYLSGKTIKARLIDDIELVHDHRQVKTIDDKNSVLTRYDVKTLGTSYNRIAEKHGLNLEGNWKEWTENQIDNLLNNRNYEFKRSCKHLLYKKIRFILKKIRF